MYVAEIMGRVKFSNRYVNSLIESIPLSKTHLYLRLWIIFLRHVWDSVFFGYLY